MAIPAASIGSIDLVEVARVNPIAAAEIQRLDLLMRRGEETDEEFLSLVRLLSETGHSDDAEYLMRRNLEYTGGEDLYRELFGSAIPDEFDFAARELAREFDLRLIPEREVGFLDRAYSSVAIGKTPRFNVFEQPCEVRITFDRKDSITAEVLAQTHSEESGRGSHVLFLRWNNGKWRLIDWRDA